jgi:hypothetical protein
MNRLKIYLTLLAFSLAVLYQFTETNTSYLEQHALSNYDSESSSVGKKKKSSKPTLDFNATLQREALTSKRSNNNPKISLFVGSGNTFHDIFSGEFENKISSDEVLCLAGHARPNLSRSPPLI